MPHVGTLYSTFRRGLLQLDKLGFLYMVKAVPLSFLETGTSRSPSCRSRATFLSPRLCGLVLAVVCRCCSSRRYDRQPSRTVCRRKCYHGRKTTPVFSVGARCSPVFWFTLEHILLIVRREPRLLVTFLQDVDSVGALVFCCFFLSRSICPTCLSLSAAGEVLFLQTGCALLRCAVSLKPFRFSFAFFVCKGNHPSSAYDHSPPSPRPRRS